MREKDLECKLRERIAKAGGRCLKFEAPGNAGVPDRIVVFPGGKIVFLELKTLQGTLRPLQKKWNQELRQLGCDARILKGECEVEAFLEEFGI